MPEIGLPAGPIPGPKVEFIPLPDPRIPETLDQANINKLRSWGVIQVDTFAGASDVLQLTGVIPNEGSSAKIWSDNRAPIWRDLKVYQYLGVAGRMAANAINYSDDSFAYGYSPTAVKLYRAGYSLDLIPAIPILRRFIVSWPEAARINLARSLETADPPPLGGFMDQPQGEILQGSTFPTDVALRFRPGSQIVEAFKIAAFVNSYPAPTATTPAPTGIRLSTDAFLIFVANILTDSRLEKEAKRELITRTAKQ